MEGKFGVDFTQQYFETVDKLSVPWQERRHAMLGCPISVWYISKPLGVGKTNDVCRCMNLVLFEPIRHTTSGIGLSRIVDSTARVSIRVRVQRQDGCNKGIALSLGHLGNIATNTIAEYHDGAANVECLVGIGLWLRVEDVELVKGLDGENNIRIRCRSPETIRVVGIQKGSNNPQTRQRPAHSSPIDTFRICMVSY